MNMKSKCHFTKMLMRSIKKNKESNNKNLNKNSFYLCSYRVSPLIGTSTKNATQEKMQRTFKSTIAFNAPG